MELPSKSELINRWNTRHDEMTLKKSVAAYSRTCNKDSGIGYVGCWIIFIY